MFVRVRVVSLFAFVLALRRELTRRPCPFVASSCSSRCRPFWLSFSHLYPSVFASSSLPPLTLFAENPSRLPHLLFFLPAYPIPTPSLSLPFPSLFVSRCFLLRLHRYGHLLPSYVSPSAPHSFSSLLSPLPLCTVPCALRNTSSRSRCTQRGGCYKGACVCACKDGNKERKEDQ